MVCRLNLHVLLEQGVLDEPVNEWLARHRAAPGYQAADKKKDKVAAKGVIA
jgi:hypothetical protein